MRCQNHFMKYKSIFSPKNIALIGASDRLGSVGRGLVKNLSEGSLRRKIYLVNPFKNSILGKKSYPNIGAIKNKIDLAIIAVPAKIVLKIAGECIQKKVGGMIIISAGFAETGKDGKAMQEKIKKLIQEKNIPMVGPNCLGIIRPPSRLNASFAPATPKSGEIAFISQSGALIDSMIDMSLDENYGFSAIISYGNEADLSLTDYLEWAASDKKTKVIALYIEGIKNGRKFFEIAKKIKKPIVALKGGKSDLTKKTVFLHTGALMGQKEIFSAAFQQAGIFEVNSLEELFDTAKILCWQPKIKNGIGVVTNGGGAGVLTADYCQEMKINLPLLSPLTLKSLDKSKTMHPAYSKNNPLDIIGDALSERYQTAIEAVLGQNNIHGLIVIQTLQIMTEPVKNAKIIINAKKNWPKKAVVSVFMGESQKTKKAISLLEKNRIPNYTDPLRAVKSIKRLIIK